MTAYDRIDCEAGVTQAKTYDGRIVSDIHIEQGDTPRLVGTLDGVITRWYLSGIATKSYTEDLYAIEG